MNRTLIGLTLVVLLCGCTTKAKVSDDTVTEEKFAEWSLALGRDKLPQPDWTAREVLAIEPPLNDSLINAIADPFATDKSWASPEGGSERDKLIGSLNEWWGLATAKPNTELTDDEVLSRFGAVVGARVLHSRLLELNGDEVDAFTMANEIVTMVNNALLTSPVLETNEFFPSALIAYENVARMSKSDKITAELKKAALKNVIVGLPAIMGSKINQDYLVVETKSLFKQLKKKDLGKELALAVDPNGTSSSIESKFSEVVGSPPTRDFEGIAKASYKTVSTLFNPRASFSEISQFVDRQTKKVESEWGVDVYNVPSDSWDAEQMKAGLAKSESAIGDTFSMSIVRKYLPYLDSAYLAQMQIDASRIRVASEIFRQQKGKYPMEYGQLDEYLKGSIIDAISQEPYQVDFKSWTLRTSQEPADKIFIFVNQAIESGAKI